MIIFKNDLERNQDGRTTKEVIDAIDEELLRREQKQFFEKRFLEREV